MSATVTIYIDGNNIKLDDVFTIELDELIRLDIIYLRCCGIVGDYFTKNKLTIDPNLSKRIKCRINITTQMENDNSSKNKTVQIEDKLVWLAYDDDFYCTKCKIPHFRSDLGNSGCGRCQGMKSRALAERRATGCLTKKDIEEDEMVMKRKEQNEKYKQLYYLTLDKNITKEEKLEREEAYKNYWETIIALDKKQDSDDDEEEDKGGDFKDDSNSASKYSFVDVSCETMWCPKCLNETGAFDIIKQDQIPIGDHGGKNPIEPIWDIYEEEDEEEEEDE